MSSGFGGGPRGPLPKDPALRQRKNKESTRATLTTTETRWKRPPGLPKRDQGWHDMTRQWWRDLWRSPMAAEYLKADVHGLYRLAVLVDRFWLAPAVGLAAQINSQEQRYGLSPLDRRRLQWIVERAEGEKRRQPRKSGSDVDPREFLRAVK